VNDTKEGRTRRRAVLDAYYADAMAKEEAYKIVSAAGSSDLRGLVPGDKRSHDGFDGVLRHGPDDALFYDIALCERSPEEVVRNTSTHHESQPRRRADSRTLDQITAQHRRVMYAAYDQEISQAGREGKG
jgi:hypothetical protein